MTTPWRTTPVSWGTVGDENNRGKVDANNNATFLLSHTDDEDEKGYLAVSEL